MFWKLYILCFFIWDSVDLWPCVYAFKPLSLPTVWRLYAEHTANYLWSRILGSICLGLMDNERHMIKLALARQCELFTEGSGTAPQRVHTCLNAGDDQKAVHLQAWLQHNEWLLTAFNKFSEYIYLCKTVKTQLIYRNLITGSLYINSLGQHVSVIPWPSSGP